MPDKKTCRREVWGFRQCAVWFVFRTKAAVDASRYDWDSIGQFILDKKFDIDRRPLLQVTHQVDTRLKKGARQNLQQALQSGELVATYNPIGRTGREPIPTDFWSKHLIAHNLSSFIPPSSDSEQYFLGVGIDRKIVEAFWPAKIMPVRKSSGRTPGYDWPACFRHLDKAFERHGELTEDDHEWSGPSHVQNEAMKFFSRHGKEPARSTIQSQVGKYLRNRKKSH